MIVRISCEHESKSARRKNAGKSRRKLPNMMFWKITGKWKDQSGKRRGLTKEQVTEGEKEWIIYYIYIYIYI